MAKSQQRTSREKKKERTTDHAAHKGPRYLESSDLSAPKLTVPKKKTKS